MDISFKKFVVLPLIFLKDNEKYNKLSNLAFFPLIEYCLLTEMSGNRYTLIGSNQCRASVTVWLLEQNTLDTHTHNLLTKK